MTAFPSPHNRDGASGTSSPRKGTAGFKAVMVVKRIGPSGRARTTSERHIQIFNSRVDTPRFRAPVRVHPNIIHKDKILVGPDLAGR